MTGVQAGLIVLKTYVHLEPLNLAQCYPTSQSGDLQLDLAPTYVSSPLLPFAKAAFDVHVTNSFSSQSVGDPPYLVSITKHLDNFRMNTRVVDTTPLIIWLVLVALMKNFCCCQRIQQRQSYKLQVQGMNPQSPLKV
jgi:hypothetical protein